MNSSAFRCVNSAARHFHMPEGCHIWNRQEVIAVAINDALVYALTRGRALEIECAKLHMADKSSQAFHSMSGIFFQEWIRQQEHVLRQDDAWAAGVQIVRRCCRQFI